jgi:predicted RNase H-like HicB family nuclease
MKFRTVLEFDPETASYFRRLPGASCASAGDTEDEVQRNINDVIALYLEPPSFTGAMF